jgi:bla regulator protein BlaR1
MSSETLLRFVANHLWQSTAFAAMAALVAVALKKNHAKVRYGAWLGASLKFVAPFALLVGMGTHLGAPVSAHAVVSPSGVALVKQIGQPFGYSTSLVSVAKEAVRPEFEPSRLAEAVFLTWLGGALFVAARWFMRWRRVARIVWQSRPLLEGPAVAAVRRGSTRFGIRRPIRIATSGAPLEPGVFGWLRPVLFLPEGIEEHLSAGQLEAVIAHEICHVQRRDNLFAGIHSVVEALFWFHPLVWWIGARLVEERERACDEAVLETGNEPAIYAEGILQTCRFYLESPAPCMSGVTGADLKERIARIMTHASTRNLGPGGKIVLALAATVALAAPLMFGLLTAPMVRAQSATAEAARPRDSFEVASIKPSDPGGRNTFVNITPGGGFRATNVNVRFLVRVAYHMQNFQISGGPGWLNSDRYDIEAKSSGGGEVDIRKLSEAQRDEFEKRIQLKVQTLLAERFNLAIHRESKEMPIYELVVAKGGPKLTPAAADDGKGPRGMRIRPGAFEGMGATLPMLAQTLSDATSRKVIDKTSITGNYDFKLDWTPEPGQMAPPPGVENETLPPPDPSGPSIFTAVQEQLGLRLESTKGSVEVLVIDRVEKPSAN